ncbi:MAG: toxic anion resistance protein [Hungatella sp.]|nr:toxic anion resistance protein [Hungatella sp.]
MAFTLDIPKKEEIKKAVEQETKVDSETSLVISDVSKEKGDEILRADIDNFEDRKELTKAIEEFGADVVKKSSDRNALMKTRIGDLSRAGGESGAVAKGLEELSRQMEDLDPSGIDFVKRGPLGKVFNPVRAYFNKYKTADSAIAEIVESLEKGARVLRDDNTTLELEQASMRELTKELNQKIVLGEELDAYLTEQINRQRALNGGSEKVKFVEEEILFPLRQRMIDFHQMLAVNQNGIIAMEVIRKNNYELIRSVNRARTVTIAALDVAVTVAGALYNQKIVLEKVKVLNQTTNSMIEATSRMLNTQGAEIQKQAMDSNIDVETLKNAFKETLEALDSINQYKQKALPQMKETIAEFRQLADAGEHVIRNMEESEIMRRENVLP